jgi:hypothetical protein
MRYPRGTRVSFVRWGHRVVGTVQESIGTTCLVTYRWHGIHLLTVEHPENLTPCENGPGRATGP